MNYNNEFSTIDTFEKAYLLGLFYADGCLSDNTASVSIIKEDAYILEELRVLFPFFNLRDYKQRNSHMSILSKGSKHICSDLIKHGLCTRKSFENKELLRYPVLSQELMGSFIRGFFDGDGSVYTPNSRLNIKIVELVSVSHNFILHLKERLAILGIHSIFSERLPNKDRKQILYRLLISKSSEVIKFRELIYSDKSTIYMKRKKDRLNNLALLSDSRKKDINDLNRALICPYCSSDQVIFNAVRQMRWGIAQRCKCKECNRSHTIKYSKEIARFPHKRKDEGMKPIN